MGIRAKVIVFVVGVVIILFTILGTTFLRLQQRVYDEEIQNRGRSLLAALSVPLAPALANMEIEILDRCVTQVTEGGTAEPLDIQSITILDYEGHVLAHTDPDEFGKSYREDPFIKRAMNSADFMFDKGLTDGHSWMKVSLPVVSGKRWGTLVAVLRMDKIQQRIAESRNYLIVSTLLCGSLAGACMFIILSRLVAKPIIELAEATMKIREGHLDARVKTRPRQKDEIDHLGQAFNEMADELQDYTRTLEQKVVARTRELQKLNEELLEAKDRVEELAITDGLTGLFNHRHLIDTLNFEIRRQERLAHPLCFLMIDVDHFKQYNDTHGHPSGDVVLRIIARLFKETLRSIDFVARYGGEEFAVLLLETEKDAGIKVAEKLRNIIEQYPFPLAKSQPGGRITISVGVASCPDDASDMESLTKKADMALYRAKQGGRNRVEAW